MKCKIFDCEKEAFDAFQLCKKHQEEVDRDYQEDMDDLESADEFENTRIKKV